MARATYVYGVVRSARKPSVTRVPAGIPGGDRPAPIRLNQRLWLVTATVPLDQYGSGPLETALRDIDWVAAVALAHEAVVEHFVRSPAAPVIPMKLFTMFSSPDRAIAEMSGRIDDLERVFSRIQGCEEWGVRVTRGEVRLTGRKTPKPQTGAAFLAARKQARDAARNAALATSEAADAAFSSLSEIARDRRRRSGEAPGTIAPLLDAAFLVPARRRARFHAAARRLARDVARSGGRMTLTGPWPPYNFVDADRAEERP